MVAAERTPCCVPFCRRTRKGDPQAEWICWDHWKRIPLEARRAYFRAVAERAPDWLAPERGRTPRWMVPRPDRHHHSDRPRSISALFRLWRRLKRIAIERAL